MWNERGFRGQAQPRGRLGTCLASVLVAVVVTADVAVRGALGLGHPAAKDTGASLVGTRRAPSPAASPSGGLAAGGDELRVMDDVEPGLVLIDSALAHKGGQIAGTGMVLTGDGLVLTNNHVVANATKITATTADGIMTYQATVVGYDKADDVALLRLQDAAGLNTIPIGDSATVRIGDRVVALGNAGGAGVIVPAPGQVTALSQTVTATGPTGIGTETLHGMIETNGGIVPGDSGGPLADSAGLVIGMDTAGNDVTFPPEMAVGFAIPIDTALAIAWRIAAGESKRKNILLQNGSGTSTHIISPDLRGE